MFIENEKKTVETVTSLTEDQFHWLKSILWFESKSNNLD